MKKLLVKGYWLLITYSMMLIHTLAFADGFPIPVPSKDQATGSNDWLDTWAPRLGIVIEIVSIAGGAMLLISAATGMMKAYHTAHEKQELTIFFKWLVIGLIMSALGIALLYAAFTAAQGLNQIGS